jgi:hypothetical protein
MLATGALPEVHVHARVQVQVHLSDIVVTARAALQDAARGLHDTMYMIVDRCGITARWE